MTFDVTYDGGAGTVFADLSRDATEHVQQKLTEIAGSEWRSPTDRHWGYTAWDGGQSSGKYKLGSYRVFADVAEDSAEIVVRDVKHRENLYR